MGRRLFVIKPSAPAYFCLIAALLCAIGGACYLMDTHPSGAFTSYWSYSFPLGLVLILIALGLGYLAIRFFRRRTDFYEQGVIACDGKRFLQVRYADLKWFSLAELDVHGRHIRQSAINFCTRKNEVFGTLAQSVIGRSDSRIERVRAIATQVIASRMHAEVMQKQKTDWIYGADGKVLTEITPTGITLTSTASFVLFSMMECSSKNGEWMLSQNGKTLLKVKCSSANFYPGLALIEKLQQKTAT